MAAAFLRPCRRPGCGIATATDTGYCPAHHRDRTRQRRQEQPRPSRRKALHKGGAGYGRAHDRWRRLVLAQDPICGWDLGAGRYCLAPATEADHIQPVRLRPDLRYDLSNGAGLCRKHHSMKTARERRQMHESEEERERREREQREWSGTGLR